MKLIETLQQRRQRIRRNIEAMRLRRIRRHTRPGYTHCMNCGTRLKGMYCHQCGQYALDIHQPIWKYIRQYFENMYQFDGKIWMTLRLMFTRPGFLTNEFNDGKINSYVHPFRLYMCISVVFFTLFFMAAERATDRALLSIAGEQIPNTVMDALLRDDAVALPDTTVYAYNTETLLQVLDARGTQHADSLIRLHYEDRGDELNLVTLPRLLFDSCLTRTAVHEETQTEVSVLRRTARLGTPDEEERFYLDLPVDTLTGRITADTYDWMTRLDQTDQLHQQATAGAALQALLPQPPLHGALCPRHAPEQPPARAARRARRHPAVALQRGPLQRCLHQRRGRRHHLPHAPRPADLPARVDARRLPRGLEQDHGEVPTHVLPLQPAGARHGNGPHRMAGGMGRV